MFLAVEKLVFRDSKIKYYSIILKINCFILHSHNSLLQWDKMRTVAHSQQLIHQGPPGLSKNYSENILYINILYYIYFSKYCYILGTLSLSLRVSVVF